MIDENDKTIRAHHSKLRIYKRVPNYIVNHPQYRELQGDLSYDSSDNDDCGDVLCHSDGEVVSNYLFESSDDSPSDLSLCSYDSALGATELYSGSSVDSAPSTCVQPIRSTCKGCEFEAKFEFNFTESSCGLELELPGHGAEDIIVGIVQSPMKNDSNCDVLKKFEENNSEHLSEITVVRKLAPITLVDWDASVKCVDEFSLPSIDSRDLVDILHKYINLINSSECLIIPSTSMSCSETWSVTIV